MLISGKGFDPDKEIIGDISHQFAFEETAFSELIQERAESATRRADAKIRIAEKRLEQIRDKVEKSRRVNLDLKVNGKTFAFTASPNTKPSVPPVPLITRPAGKKGASDEERLMILQMLQDKKITVEEAETLFRALEE